VISRGRRTATAEARPVDANGTLIAHATSTFLLFPMTPDG
jgi:acyl-coenzyme A thioesterase PaaI-like protein